MPITEINGDIFDSKAKVLINPVNCVGIMGKGLALQFKNKFPTMFKHYRELCDKKLFKCGYPYLYDLKNEKDLDKRVRTEFVLNFPTKNHWKNDSTLEIIEEGLINLVELINMHKLKFIALPHLGCGCGNLNYKDVRDLIFKYLKDLDVEIEIYNRD